ncbi:MAG: GNAT family N-acetyltransferase [Acidobacteriia bacterium]|nr:GNAT family N-acetyltransferase [Terriglobia bacterium]
MTNAITFRKPREIHIRPAVNSDLLGLIALDEEITGLAKRKYWKETFARYGARRRLSRFFLVAEYRGRIEGFIIGEVRAWEFGEPPCGWIFTVQVRPKTRLKGIGTQLFETLCDAFRHAGVQKVRTMMARDNQLVLSFFRSQGMMAGPFIELEAALD